MKTYTLEDTLDPDLKRLVDRDGNWERYFHVPTEKYLDGVTTILSKGYPKGIAFEQWLGSKTDEERQDILAEATSRGSQVHLAIDLLIREPGTATLRRETPIYDRESGQDKQLSNRAWDNLLAFSRFWTAHEPEVYAAEKAVYSITDGYAGTTDAILKLTKACSVNSCPCEPLVGKVGVWDWKTGAKPYPNHLAQVAAYSYSENMTVTADYGAVLALGSKAVLTGGYCFEAAVGPELVDAHERFLAAKQLADIPPFDPKKAIRDIPDSITITAPRPPEEQAETEAEAQSETTEHNETNVTQGQD